MSNTTDNSSILIHPVGEVRSEQKTASLRFEEGKLKMHHTDQFRGGFGDFVSRIVIYDEYSDCLQGLEEFSHILVLYWSHFAEGEGREVSLVHPAGQEDLPLVGVFSTRSPARPNPICVTTVELLEREGNILTVKGLDAVDGSPVIDIKPHHPHFDAPEDVRLAGWMQELMKRAAEARRE